MGCIFAKPDHNGRQIFRVFNVDENGEELNNGKIEVTDSDLILFHRGKEIRWPLRCLRRYGWEGELFSFESGRRCQTGPGIYAFKCKRSELLFNSVQESIRRAGQMELGASQMFDASHIPSSRPTSVMELNDFSVGNGSISNGNTLFASATNDTQNYVNQPEVSDPPQYINTKFTKSQNRSAPENNAELLMNFMHEYPQEREQRPQNYAVLEFSSSGDENSCPDETRGDTRNPSSRGLEVDGDLDEGFPVAEDDVDVFYPDNPRNDYLNVGVEPVRPPPPRTSYREPIREVNYSNISTKVTDTNNTMNYIQVDNSSRPSNGAVAPTQTFSSQRDSPPKSGCHYSLIDPDKTKALLESGRRNLDDGFDEGIRKTRHDSTFTDM